MSRERLLGLPFYEAPPGTFPPGEIRFGHPARSLATITITVSDEFLEDQGAAVVERCALESLDGWAKERGYVRAEAYETKVLNITDQEPDREELRRAHIQRWKAVAYYRILTPEEDRKDRP